MNLLSAYDSEFRAKIRINLETTVGSVVLSVFARFSLRLLAKWSVKPAYRQAGSLECLSPQGEY